MQLTLAEEAPTIFCTLFCLVCPNKRVNFV
jgi:hypothetical protein